VVDILDENPELADGPTASEIFNDWLDRLHESLDRLRDRLTV
jgi:hypothetical protein